VSPVINRIRFIEADIADFDLVSQVVKRYGIEQVVNFAAETHVDRSITNSIPFLHANVLGVQSLVEVCKVIPALRLFHVSTDEVYGDLKDGQRPCKPEDPLRPSSPYAATKASGDLLILAAIRTYGIQAKIARCTNNFGPHQASEKFIPTVIRSALAHKPVPIYAAGKNKRDWLFVTDHCDALETILRAETSESVFNVSADDERENLEVAKQILSLLGKPESLLQFVPDRPGHDWRYALDSSGTRALGWKPAVPFAEGLQRTIDWFRSRHL